MEPIAIGTPDEEDAEHELLVYAGVREVEQVDPGVPIVDVDRRSRIDPGDDDEEDESDLEERDAIQTCASAIHALRL